MNDINAIELTLPGKNPTVIPVNRINSLALQLKSSETAYEDMVFIGIDGWEKPFVFEGNQATSIYNRIKSILGATLLEFDES